MSASIVSLQFSSSSSSCHHLLTRRVSDVVLLLLNVPPWCNEAHLKSLLADSCGGVKLLQFLSSKAETEAWSSSTPPPIPVASDEVESPYFKKKPEVRFHDALVVFKNATGAQKLLARKKEEPLVLQSETRKPVVGLRRWISDYSSSIITDWNHFQKDLDDYMIEYDAKKEEEIAELKEMGEVADDDGWVTVTSKSKKGAKKPKNNETAKSRAKAKAIGQKKELLNFYKFQKKEKKEDLIQNLREKFEEDKKRVSLMRAERKFKPY